MNVLVSVNEPEEMVALGERLVGQYGSISCEPKIREKRPTSTEVALVLVKSSALIEGYRKKWLHGVRARAYSREYGLFGRNTRDSEPTAALCYRLISVQPPSTIHRVGLNVSPNQPADSRSGPQH